MTRGRWTPPLLSKVLPALAEEVIAGLLVLERADLAAQVCSLRVACRCRCGDDFCATVHLMPGPRGNRKSEPETLDLDAKEGWLILDVVEGRIETIEVLYRPEVRRVLDELLP